MDAGLMRTMTKLREKMIRYFCIKTWNFWEKMGFYILPKHFHWPIPETDNLVKHNFEKKFPLDGIHLDDSSMLTLLYNIGEFKSEYLEIYSETPYESNGDGAILYGMVRQFKPKNIIEVGSGASTKVSLFASEKNEKEGEPCEIIAIEPYPSNDLLKLSKKYKNLSLIKEKVEGVGFEPFMKLKQTIYFLLTHLM